MEMSRVLRQCHDVLAFSLREFGRLQQPVPPELMLEEATSALAHGGLHNLLIGRLEGRFILPH